jgi:hypothetical protein
MHFQEEPLLLSIFIMRLKRNGILRCRQADFRGIIMKGEVVGGAGFECA